MPPFLPATLFPFLVPLLCLLCFFPSPPPHLYPTFSFLPPHLSPSPIFSQLLLHLIPRQTSISLTTCASCFAPRSPSFPFPHPINPMAYQQLLSQQRGLSAFGHTPPLIQPPPAFAGRQPGLGLSSVPASPHNSNLSSKVSRDNISVIFGHPSAFAPSLGEICGANREGPQLPQWGPHDRQQ